MTISIITTSIFDLFKGTSAEPSQPAQQQVASAEPQALPETPAEPVAQAKQAAAPAAALSGYANGRNHGDE